MEKPNLQVTDTDEGEESKVNGIYQIPNKIKKQTCLNYRKTHSKRYERHTECQIDKTRKGNFHGLSELKQ